MANLTNVSKIGAGVESSLFLVNKNGSSSIFGCGWAQFGQLGVGQMITTVNVPTQALDITNVVSLAMGGYFSAVLTSNGTVYTTGYNIYGELGLGDKSARYIYQQVTGIPKVKALTAGRNTLFLTTTNDQVWVCGANTAGALGVGDYQDQNFPMQILWGQENPIQEIASADTFTIFLSRNRVYLTGFFSVPAHSPKQIFSLGGTNSMIESSQSTANWVNSSGIWQVFGNNYWGQLGVGHYLPVYHPTKILLDAKLTIVKVSPSVYHTIFLTSNGDVYVAGDDFYGQLGMGNSQNIEPLAYFTPTRNPFIVGATDVATCGSFEYKLNLHGGNSFVLANGTLYVHGHNDIGQLGLNDTIIRYYPTPVPNFSNINYVWAGANQAFFATQDGTLFGFGRNDWGQLGSGNQEVSMSPIVIPISNVTQIIPNTFVTYFLLFNGSVFGSGNNRWGLLAFGDTMDRYNLTLLPIPFTVTKIGSMAQNSFFLDDKGQVYGVGRNLNGELGVGDTKPYTSPIMIPNFNNVIDVKAVGTVSIILTSCSDQWSGPSCRIPVCFGISGADVTRVCFGRGSCTSSDKCSCYNGSSGTQCEFSEYHWKGFSGSWSNPQNWKILRGPFGLVDTFTVPLGNGDVVYFDSELSDYSVVFDILTLNLGALIFSSSTAFHLQSVTLKTATLTVNANSKVNFISSSIQTSQGTISGSTTFQNTILSGKVDFYASPKMHTLNTFTSLIGSFRSPTNFSSELNIMNSQVTLYSSANLLATMNIQYSNTTIMDSDFTIYSSILAKSSNLQNFGVVHVNTNLQDISMDISIYNGKDFIISGQNVLKIESFNQSETGNLNLINSTVKSQGEFNIMEGNALLSGNIMSPKFTFGGRNLRIQNRISVQGDFVALDSSAIFFNIDRSGSEIIECSGNSTFGSSIFLQLQKDFIPNTFDSILFYISKTPRSLLSADQAGVFLFGANFKTAEINFENGQGFFRIVPSFGSADAAGYICHYLGDKIVLEMTPMKRNHIISITFPQVANSIGFGFDLNGTLLNSLLFSSIPSNGTYITHQVNLARDFPVSLAITSVSPNFFGSWNYQALITPLYQTIYVLFPSSYLKTQKYVFFGEFVGSEMNESITTFRKYTFQISPPIKGSIIDCTNFAQPLRVEIYSLGVTITILILYVIILILCIVFSRNTPLNSRGISPALTVLFLFIQLILEIRNYFPITDFQGSLCFFYSFAMYPLHQIVFVMILFYFLRYFIVINLNTGKKRLRRLNQDSLGKFHHLVMRIFKIVSTSYFIVGGVIAYYFVMMIINLIVIASYGFICRFETLLILRIIDSIALIAIYVLTLISLILDIILNFKPRYLLKCQFYEYIFLNDPYFFRVQILLFLPFMIFSLATELAHIGTSTYYQIIQFFQFTLVVNTIQASILLVIDVLFPLAITIVYKMRDLCFNKKKTIGGLEIMLKDPVVEELFIKFCEKEFSVENILCWKEIQTFKINKEDPLRIYFKFFNGNSSPMEVNVAKSDRTKLYEKIKEGKIDETLFDDVLMSLQSNLSDTWSRFMFVSSYVSHLEKNKNQTELIQN